MARHACKTKPSSDKPKTVLNKEGICAKCWKRCYCQICFTIWTGNPPAALRWNGFEDMLWSCRDCQRRNSTCCEGLGWCQCSTNVCKDCLPKYYKCYCDTCDHEVSWPVIPFIVEIEDPRVFNVDDGYKYPCPFCKKKSYFSYRDIRDKSDKK